ncbi:hypothetical protein FRB94_009076 [Tulasnella sp. JGI-2019a]|nr:hypothetical protein FRB93_001681 [Tulasnella sp. JGI-2019a]KAG9011150.1 hypothetical protein FRB94_009076 [Tulasnella sp. JGI-2019a]
MKVISEAAYIPNILKNILDNYPAGSAVLREFLQNSDDAGARSQDFILDARTFSSARLYDPGLESCQGPALLAVNDSHFLPKDWVAITTIMDSSKTADETSTGKYGLGFRSCYHITDNPQILSGKDLLILDPHRRIQSAPGGLSLDLGDSKDRCFLGHFSTFGSILQEDATNYNGTAIRLPLRLPPQAEISDIKKVPTSVDTIRNILHDFIERELPEVMLFLKNITSIGLFEVGTDGVKRQIGRGWIDNPEAVVERRSCSRGREIETSHYDMTIQLEVGEATSRRSWLLTHFVEDYEVAKTVMSQRTHQNIDVVGKAMVADKLLPYVALALPLSDAELHTEKHYLQRGRLFTLLPLPIFTGFPAHLHSVLALTSSRQNLRNTQDVTARSREQFLVEWNRAIFSDLAPKAWAAMLLRMAEKALDPLKAWPAVLGTSDGGDPEYWAALPSALLRQAGPKPIWPNLRTDGTYQYMPLTKLLVAAPGTDAKVLEILTRCAVLVTLPAPPIYALIQKSNDFAGRMLTPQTAYIELKSNVKLIRQLDASAVTALCHYLTSANDITLISGIPVVPNVGGTYTTIDLRSKYKLADVDEATLFKFVDSQLLAMESMTPRTCQLLLKPPTCIKRLQAVDVIEYLSRLYLKFNDMNSVTVEDVSWLVRFWNWAGGWKGSASFLQDWNLRNRLAGLKVVPFSSADDTNEIGQFKKAAVDPVGVDTALLQALRELHIPVLHAGVKSRGAVVQEAIGSVNDVAFLLQQLPMSTTINLSHPSRLRLHEHLAARLGSSPKLSRAEVNALRELPVFTVLPPGIRTVGSSSYGPCPATSCVVDDSVQVVPVINGIAFIDATECRPLLSAIWKTLPKGKNTAGEKDVLELAIRNWAQQGQVSDLPDLLINRVFRRLSDLSPNTRELLKSLPIVDVGPGHPKRSLTQVVDPSSSIAPLFDPEDRVLPHGTFAQDAPSGHLKQLRNENMLQSEITMKVVEERITRIVDFVNPPQEKGPKALLLLHLLDDLYRRTSLPRDPFEWIISQQWLPVGDQMYSPSQCWDQRPSDRDLCDRVLPLVDIKLKSNELRRLLGWQTLPFDVLMRQFIVAVSSARPSQGDYNRIDALIRRLAHDVANNTCTEEDLTCLGEALGSKPWVPVSGGLCAPSHRCVIANFEVTSRFHRVSRHLLEDAKVSKFLATMGVPDRPSNDVLYEEIKCISSELYQSGLAIDAKSQLVTSAISILQALSRHLGPLLDRSRILVPCEAMTLEPFDTIIYNDVGDKLGDIPLDYKTAHSDISSALAGRLGLMRLSDDRFADDEDQLESFQIGEALPTRIMGVLKDYDKEYASNEWVANADDAGAKEVAFVIDEVVVEGGSLLSPHLTEFQRSPALIIYNDGVFSDKDFEGLGNIGKGGKTDSPESIGRFGLGAFSFYHFTELPMVVSASSVLFLDPSQSYLPRNRTGAHRTGVKIPLGLCIAKYPGHLKSLDGLFNFTMDLPYYAGTLFRLPLRTPQQAKDSKLSASSFSVLDIAQLATKFYHLSAQSLFFSHLHKISAYRRGTDAKLTVMWSVTAARKTPEATRSTTSIMKLSVQPEEPHRPYKENWLIASEKKRLEDIPERLQPLISPHRLPPPTVAIALKLTSPGDGGASTEDGESRLFATLPLPIPISLPVHIHATWILSRDRRSLRFDAPDAHGEKPLDTQYNEFLLENLAAPLYISVIAVVASGYKTFYEACWPGDPTDVISRTLSVALYSQFVTTEENICVTATEDVIPPSQAIFHTSTSRSVQAVLTELKIPGFVSRLPFDKSVVDWHDLRVDDANEVARLLRAQGSAINRVFLGPLVDTHLDGLIQFLLKGEVDLDGLSLLQLGNGDLIKFRRSSERPIFAATHEYIADLFGNDRVLGNALKPGTVEQLLLAEGLNVATFDADRLRRLVSEREPSIRPGLQKAISEGEGTWMVSLLNAFSREDTLTLQAVRDLPLIPTRNGGLAISLEMLESRASAISTSSLILGDALVPALIGLGIVIAESLPGVPHKPAVFDLPYFLDAVTSLGRPLHTLHQAPAMTEPAWHQLIGWIHMHLRTRVDNMLSQAQSDTLAELPIFEGQNGGADSMITLQPASAVTMLPPRVDLDATGGYLPGNTVFASFSIELNGLLAVRPDQRLHHEGFFSRLRLPKSLPEYSDQQFRRLLDVVITHHARPLEKAIVPDMNRVLRLPRSMYDHGVRLFATVLADRPQALVHPAFRMFTQGMVPLGVHREVGIKELIACATVLDEDGRQGRPIRERANLYWEIFRDSDHTRRISYETISTLRFIPTAAQRHLYVPEFGQFGHPLPDVVAPSEITTAEQSPILWTQRARFDEAPPDFLRAVMPDLGRPFVGEVVQHLVVLATQVAPIHPSHRNLLSDLSATYNWLSTNMEEAGEELLQLSGTALWLNVDNAVQDTWVWRAARELVFDLRWDDEVGRHYDANGFLLPFKPLLLASGAHEHRHPALPPVEPLDTQLTYHERVQVGFDELRVAECLTDIHFNIDEEIIRAHRAILAAVVPHFMTVFRGEFKEGRTAASRAEPMTYDLSHATTSMFAIRSVVDYAYTGNFKLPLCNNTEEAGPALASLLDLLDLSNLWDMDELKRKTQEAIVELKLVRLETCDEILTRAATCQALALVEVCQKTKEVNNWSG